MDIQLGKAIEPGQGLKVKAAYHYEGTSSVPSSAKLNIKGDNGFLYSDVALNKAISTDYAKLDVAPILRAQGIPEDKIEKCLKECAEHPNLKKYLARDPKNAQRWMNTRNPVDDRLVARRADGRRVQNYAYAGNVYYFDPANNRGLASRLVQGRGYANLKNGIPLKDGKKLKVLSLEQLEELDRMYPDGITFSKQGHPDFTPVAYKRGGKPVIYDLSEFNQGKVERNGDINKANKLFARDHGFATPSGYTWHHIEGTRKVVLVRTDVHELIDHAGGISMAKVGKG